MFSLIVNSAFRKGSLCRHLASGRTTKCSYLFNSSATKSTEVIRSEDETENSNFSLRLSDSCVDRLKYIAADGSFLRVLVEGGGCSGFQYKFELDTVIKEDDKSFERDGVKVVIDEISLPLITGSTIDYKEELIRSAFRIVNNPQADAKCSCGVSFSVKM